MMTLFSFLKRRLSAMLGRIEVGTDKQIVVEAGVLPAGEAVEAAGAAPLVATEPAVMVDTIEDQATELPNIEISQRMMSARLASVSLLNTKAGRKPFRRDKAQNGRTAVPVARIGAKKQRNSGAPRIAIRNAPVRTAQIIRFPVRPRAIVESRSSGIPQVALAA